PGSCTCFLFFHCLSKSWYIHLQIVLSCHEFGQVDREPVGIVQQKSIFTRNATFFGFEHMEALNPLFQRSEKTLFFLMDHFGDEFFLGFQFRKDRLKLIGEMVDEQIQQWFFPIEKSIVIPDGSPQNPPDDVSRPRISGYLPICYGKSHGSDMIG